MFSSEKYVTRVESPKVFFRLTQDSYSRSYMHLDARIDACTRVCRPPISAFMRKVRGLSPVRAQIRGCSILFRKHGNIKFSRFFQIYTPIHAKIQETRVFINAKTTFYSQVSLRVKGSARRGPYCTWPILNII